ncbi:hypothetical protein G3I60_04490 [Streptomyces sp. SID13666]|uniref:SUKH-3 domain-containing protein n=1 Tax=Streptomyces sp. SID13666 TaxID=2706054 RepID=UPI0013C27EFD|nr:hypothetical protein [Streptomyces sp. SID13666]NEA69238.1 hypothetical protein [Streptomyces sp. SID13588]
MVSARKEPHLWSVEVEATLRGAGWYPGRSIDTTAWRERLEADGFPIHSAAEEFLREFGGLTVGTGGAGITSSRAAFELNPLIARAKATASANGAKRSDVTSLRWGARPRPLPPRFG